MSDTPERSDDADPGLSNNRADDSPSDAPTADGQPGAPTASIANARPVASTSSTEVVGLGIGVVVLVIAALATLIVLTGDDDSTTVSIGADPAATTPTPTYDASIGVDDERITGVVERDSGGIAITDEPIVIDADGNVVDPAGGNAGDPLPSEAFDSDSGATDDDSNSERNEPLEVPDDAYTGTTAVESVATTIDPDSDDDDGTNLLGGDDPEDKLMPDLICRGLQAAQDEIQDHGVFGSKSKDATGSGRRQIWDRNWVVVAQDPEPGEKIGEFEAVLYVVKKSDDENPCD